MLAGQGDLVQDGLTAGVGHGPRHSGEVRQAAQPIERAQFLGHRLALRTIADALDEPRIVPRRFAKNRQPPRTGLKLAGDDLDEGALPRAVGADQSRQARADLEGDIVQPHDHAVPPAQFFGLDDCAHSGLTRFTTTTAASPVINSNATSAPPMAGEVSAAIVSGRILLNMVPKMGTLSWAILRSSPSRNTANAIWSRLKLKLKWRSQGWVWAAIRSEEHTSELQSLRHLVCRLLLENN